MNNHLKGIVCTKCGAQATKWARRCDEHYVCDGCGQADDPDHILTYSSRRGLLCEDCRQAAIQKAIAEFDGDTSWESEITCPFCGYVHSDSWEHNDSDGEEFECSECEHVFLVTVNKTVTYTTEKPE